MSTSMIKNQRSPRLRPRRVCGLLKALSLSLCLGCITVWGTDSVMANIFGDGNPDNGIEDNRQRLLGGRDSASGLNDQQMNAGTIKCDGKVRGTAMVVDTRDTAPGLMGVVIASAAHVVYDLDKNTLFDRCDFHFLALDQLDAYRAKIDLKTIRKGQYDPAAPTDGPEFGEGDWAFLYIPEPWKSFRPENTLKLADFAVLKSELFLQSGGEIRLIAYDSDARVISFSNECSVIESGINDLGGGKWTGQLLDDCDSADGASGGGIIAVIDQQHHLVGIRGGAHWSEQYYPKASFPSGPPDGSRWDLNANTNFGRAIDAKIMRQFVDFIHMIEINEKRF